MVLQIGTPNAQKLTVDCYELILRILSRKITFSHQANEKLFCSRIESQFSNIRF